MIRSAGTAPLDASPPIALERRSRARTGSAAAAFVVLTQNRVFVMPSRVGGLFCLTLALMLVGSVNYSLGLGYILTFLLAGVGFVGLLHTWRNLAGLDVRPARRESVFAGDHVRFHFILRNPTRLPRFAIGIRRSRELACFRNVPVGAEVEAFVEMVAPTRGWLEPGRMEIATSYPLGLFRAWSHLRFEQRALVYPRPEQGAPPPPLMAESAIAGMASAGGEDDFGGLREYRPGDPLKSIAWKATARRDMPVTKEFSGGTGGTRLLLDWHQCPSDFDTERRLSRLTAWVLMADRLGASYGLGIPGQRVPMNRGSAHRDRCLEALALFAR